MKLILLLWKKEGATTTLLRHVSSAASVFKNSHLLGRIICRVCYIYQLFWNRFCHLHINKSSIIIYCQFIEKNHFYQIVHLQMIYALISSSGFISLSCQQIIKLYSSLLSANSAAAVRPHLNYREHLYCQKNMFVTWLMSSLNWINDRRHMYTSETWICSQNSEKRK